MKTLRNTLASAMMLALTSPAYALFIDFQYMADVSVGEGGYSVLSVGGMDIRGFDGPGAGDTAFAYLDENTGGLGVCSTLNGDQSDGKHCTPSSDDNVSFDAGDSGAEWLEITFTQTMRVDNIVFNNNHDPDKRLDGDTITIDGVDKTFGAGDIIGANVDGDRDYLYTMGKLFQAGTKLIISYYTGGDPQKQGDEFYLTGIDVVPEPLSLALLGLGLLGFGAIRRKA